MKIFVVSDTEKQFKEFAKINKHFSGCLIQCDKNKELNLLLKDILTSEEAPFLICDDSVYLPVDIIERSFLLCEVLFENYENWGMVGNCGVSCLKVGARASQFVKYANDSNGHFNLKGKLLPAESLYGSIFLINPNGNYEDIIIPAVKAFSTLATALSFASVVSKRSCFIAPELMCYQNAISNVCDKTDDEYELIRDYLTSLFVNSRINYKYSSFNIDKPTGSIDLVDSALGNCVRRKNKTTLSIIVRTQFTRLKALFRTLSSIKSFSTMADASCDIRCYVITDNLEGPDKTYYGYNVLKCESQKKDSRFSLIANAIKLIDSDYVWFIDDDDWVFPNVAHQISQVLCSCPKKSTIYLDVRHFNETVDFNDLNTSELTASRYFPAKNFIKNFSGENYSPFCGVIFPKVVLERIINSSMINSVTLMEDFMLHVINSNTEEFFPVIIDKLSVGISIRQSGQTMSMSDDKPWRLSGGTVYYHMITNGNGLLFSQSDTENLPCEFKIKIPKFAKIICLFVYDLKLLILKVNEKINKNKKRRELYRQKWKDLRLKKIQFKELIG